MTAEDLFLAIGGAEEEFLAHSEEPVRKKPVPRRAWAAAAACLALVLAGTWALRSAPDGGEVSGPQGGGSNAAGCLDEFPGGIDPVLRVNGELYHWYGAVISTPGMPISGRESKNRFSSEKSIPAPPYHILRSL